MSKITTILCQGYYNPHITFMCLSGLCLEKNLCIPELGHQETFQRLQPALCLAFNKKDIQVLIDLISVVVIYYLQGIITKSKKKKKSGIYTCFSY